MSRPDPRRRPVRLARLGALIIVAATVLPLTGAPVAAAPGTRHRGPAGGVMRLAALPAGAHHAARIDSGLAGGHGPVTVMLRLARRSAAAAYTHPLTAATTIRGRRAAFAVQRQVIDREQGAVAARFDAPATRARELYRLSAGYNGIAVRTTASRLTALSRLPGVTAIQRIAPLHQLNSVTVPLINAPQVWQGAAGNTGAGVTIGVIDSGLDYTHADFGGPGTKAAYDAAKATDTKAPAAGSFDPAKFVGGVDLVGDAYDAAAGEPGNPSGDKNPADAVPHPDPNPLDCSSHGTHVAGTAAGYGVLANRDSAKGTDYSTLGSLPPSQYQDKFRIGPGVAPEARIYSVKVFGCSEDSDTNVVPQAIDRLIRQNLSGAGPHIDVINLSLGGDYSSAQDPTAAEANAAVKDAGIEVVSAAGNAGDVYDVLGSPADAVRGLAVSASDDSQDITDGLRVKSPADIAGVLPGEHSVDFDWASMPHPISGDLVTTGDITAPPSGRNNADGCDPVTQDLTGKVAYLSWSDNDVLRRCGSADRTDNVRDAGAVGAVFFDDENEFVADIAGDAAIPATLITKSAGAAINAQLAAQRTVNVSFDNALTSDSENNHPETTNAITPFSSRGIAVSGDLKPDVTAPGQTVFSAGMATGSDGFSFSGTSMATPHAAGVAALVRAAHPRWSAMQVKAAIMNTATQDVFARTANSAANPSAPMAPMRVGAGRVRADRAVATSTLAYLDNSSGAVSVSFGRVDVSSPTVTRSAKVRVLNTSSAPVTYGIGYAAADAMPGASYAVVPSSLTLGAGMSGDVTVTLTAHRDQLVARPDPTVVSDPLGIGEQQSFIGDISGSLTVTPAGGTALRVPVYAAPRPISAMRAPDTVAVRNGAGAFRLAGRGVDNSRLSMRRGDALEASKLDAFELQGTSGRRPVCSSRVRTRCVAFPDQRAGDLKAIGFASDVQGMLAHHVANSIVGAVDRKAAFGYFGVATHGPWHTEAGIQEFDVFLDVDGNPGPDAVLYNTRIATTADTDYLVSELDDMRGNLLDQELINNTDGSLDTNIFDSDVLTLPFALEALERVGWHPHRHPRIRYFVDSIVAEQAPKFSDQVSLFDSIGDPFAGQRLFSVDLARPALSVTARSHVCTVAGICGVLIPDKPGKQLSVRMLTKQLAGDRAKGIMLFHHDNPTGAREEVVAVGRVGRAVHH